jgi:hypothetical protein
MVIPIDDLLHKVRKPAFRVTKVASPPREVGPEHDDDGPNDDPPNAIRLAA